MSNIWITGANGFLGKNLVKYWLDNDDDYDRLLTPDSINGSLNWKTKIIQYIRYHKVDAIIHLASLCGGIGANRDRPGEFIYKNLLVGANLIEGARECGVRRIVLLSTICAYPKFTESPFKENDLWNGYPEETNAAYGIAKKTIMEMGRAYNQQYDMDIITLMPTNLVGPYDHFEEHRSHVIPALIKKIDDAIKINAPSITVWGDGSASREFLDVRDASRAIYLAYKNYSSSEPVNIGTGQEITIKDLVKTLCSIMEYKGQIIWDTSKPNGQPRRCLDTTRAREFGFKAKIPLEQSLKDTIKYYRSL